MHGNPCARVGRGITRASSPPSSLSDLWLPRSNVSRQAALGARRVRELCATAIPAPSTRPVPNHRRGMRAGGRPLFGIGPFCVLTTSVLNWASPSRTSARRHLDVATVRLGFAFQVMIAHIYCRAGGVASLLAGYSLGGACYAAGRVLTVRGRRLAGAWVHTGIHVFANAGNLAALRLVP